MSVPKLKAQEEYPVALPLHLGASVQTEVYLDEPGLLEPIAQDLSNFAIVSRLAVFLPHFRVEGKSFRDSQLRFETTLQAPGQKSVGNTPSRQKFPSPLTINKWDALWPLLQPPLNFAFPESLDLPSDLRPYQIDGVRFLADHDSALLGDDMGTGKTVQATVAMRILLQKGKISRALVVCPLAVLSSWEEHLVNWGRVFKSVSIRGNKNERKLQWQTQAHIYLTTYDVIREDIDSISYDGEPREFDLIVADEVQKLKNSGTATAKAIRAIGAPRRWGLSATPFENRPEELVSVFAFIKPGLLVREGENPKSIREKIAPFFLRRTKDVLKGELPEKVHDVVWLEMDHAQRRAYDLAEKQGIVELEQQGERVTVTHVLALLQKLKQLCNFEPRTRESIKLDTLRERFDEVAEQGSKALVFTQFKDKDFGVARIQSAFQKDETLHYTGDLSYVERGRTLERFQNDPGCKLMVCTQAAAGLGLNLTCANYVFHFDHWWNPARTSQAEDRVHRIGQRKTVFVYHFWARNSVEERIYAILQRKRAQFEEVIGPMSNAEGTGLSEDELFEIFGLKKSPRPASRVQSARMPREEPAVTPAGIANPPEVDVWPLIRRTELALRKCVREALMLRYGQHAQTQLLTLLGSEEANRITDAIAHYKRKYSTSRHDEFSPSEDPLDYTYLKQMMQVISREWQLFKPIFGDRGYIDGKITDIAAVRNDEAHFRGIPAIEKMRAYVACSDLLARLQPRPAVDKNAQSC